MDWGIGWAIIGVAVTCVGLYFAIRTYVRDYPRRRIEYKITERPLLTTRQSNQIEVRARGVPIRDPYLVEVVLESNSRVAISPDEFGQGKPTSIFLYPQCVLVGISLTGEGLRVTGISEHPDSTRIDIGPALIEPRDQVRLTVISAGPGRHRVQRSLARIEVRPKREPKLRRRLSVLGDITFRYLVMPILVLIIAFWAFGLVVWIIGQING